MGLGLRIARDIFASGRGRAPRRTPNNAAVPPIITPAPNSPMPARPRQPGSVRGCANTLPVPLPPRPAADRGDQVEQERAAKGSSNKGAKGAAKKGAPREAPPLEAFEQDQNAWPSGISEQDQDELGAQGQGAWPSGISEK